MAKKEIKPDFLYRAVSLLIAIGLWFFVAYAENPEMELWFKDIPITYTNESVLAERGLVRIKGEESLVSLKVRGNRRAIVALSASDIVATVDLSSVKSAKTYTMPITVKFPVDGLVVSDKKPYSVEVVAENIVTRDFPVEIVRQGQVPENIEIAEVTPLLKKVSVSGGAGMIEGIESVCAVLDVSDITSNKKLQAPITVNMKDGSIGADLQLSNTFAEIDVFVNITKDIPINVVYSEDCVSIVKNTKIEPDTVKVYGKYEDVNAISKINTKPVTVSRKYETEKITTYIEIPEGVKNVDNITTVVVDTTILKDSVENE